MKIKFNDISLGFSIKAAANLIMLHQASSILTLLVVVLQCVHSMAFNEVNFNVYREHERGQFMIRYHKDASCRTIPDPNLEVNDNDYHLSIGDLHYLVFRKLDDASTFFDGYEVNINFRQRYVCSYRDKGFGVLFTYTVDEKTQKGTLESGCDAICADI